jgi:HEAT repeat protein
VRRRRILPVLFAAILLPSAALGLLGLRAFRDETRRARAQLDGEAARAVDAARGALARELERVARGEGEALGVKAAASGLLTAPLLARPDDVASGPADPALYAFLPSEIDRLEAAGAIDRAAQRLRQVAASLLYEPAIPLLGQALEDLDQDVREQARAAFHAFKEHREALEEFAAWTLGDRAARAQIDELIALLSSPDREVVLGAVNALGAVRGRAALPDLVRLLARDDEALRTAVHAAIERMGR